MAQEPYNVKILNRTTYNLRLINRSGSDWADSTLRLPCGSKNGHVIKSGAALTVYPKAASSWGTDQWNRLWFEATPHYGGGGKKYILFYVESTDVDSMECRARLNDTPDFSIEGQGNLGPGIDVGNLANPKPMLSFWQHYFGGGHQAEELFNRLSGNYSRERIFVLSGADLFPIPSAPAPGESDLTRWMGTLVDNLPETRNWPLFAWKLPGSHDAGTYGFNSETRVEALPYVPPRWQGLLSKGNWQCQSQNLYGQASCGTRYFDIRLCRGLLGRDPSEVTSTQLDEQFWPKHGDAKMTGDAFNLDAHNVGTNQATLISQIKTFASEHPTEFIILNITDIDNADQNDVQQNLAKAIVNLLGDVLAPYPRDGPPTYNHVTSGGRNIILHSIFEPSKRTVSTEYAKILDESWDWKNSGYFGDNDNLLYNDDTWKSGQFTRVLASIIAYAAQKFEAIPRPQGWFWNAQLQLTPALDKDDAIRFLSHPSYRPRSLADESRAALLGMVPAVPLLYSCGNVMSYDFVDEQTSKAIVGMNWFHRGLGADTLQTNVKLRKGEFLSSRDGAVTLLMQDDGNLVLYNRACWEPLWAHNGDNTTEAKKADFLVAQDDGNLCLCKEDGVPVWATNTNGKGAGAKLILQEDFNMVLYSREHWILWSTGTTEETQYPKPPETQS